MSKLINIIAGDTSGDNYTADLIKKLKENNNDYIFEGIAGDQAEAVGMKLWTHSKNLNFMGFVEILSKYKLIRETWKTITNNIKEKQPDLLILIDYPGLNLKIAKWAKQYDIKILYYIPPQVWCWKQNRIKALQQYTNFIAPLYPHEAAFFEKKCVPYQAIRHPELDKVKPEVLRNVENDEFINILCMPGSRKNEIDNNFTPMLAAINNLQEQNITNKKMQIYVIKAQTQSNLEAICKEWQHKLKINILPYYDKDIALSKAHVACVTSGTASLEVGLSAIPMLVMYKSQIILKYIIKYIFKGNIKWISLPNLICQKNIVTELKDIKLPPETIAKELEQLLFNNEKRTTAYNDLIEMRETLSKSGKYEIDELIELALNSN